MKKVIAFLGLIAILAALPAFTNRDDSGLQIDDTLNLRSVTNTAFTYGEKLEYRVHYGFVNAGYIDLEVKPQPVTVKGRGTYHIDGFGRSRSGFDWMFKVRDHFESFLDTQAILPLQFIKNQKEGGYEDTDFVLFNYKLKKYFSKKGSQEIPLDIQDVLSVAYYARTLDVKDKPIGTEFLLNVYLDNEIHTLKFRIDGFETLKTDVGKIKTIRVIPEVIGGRVFKDKNALKVWVSNDDNKLPVRLQADILVGSIKVDITKYSGLMRGLNFK